MAKISQELLYLETRNFVHMTSMTSCIVGKKIRVMEPGSLELFPFVVLAILMAMAGGISEHMLTSWSSFFVVFFFFFFFFFCFLLQATFLNGYRSMCFQHLYTP